MTYPFAGHDLWLQEPYYSKAECVCPMVQDECWGFSCDCECHEDDMLSARDQAADRKWEESREAAWDR